MNPQHCSKPYDRDMSAQREACTFNRRIETPMIDAVLREAKEASGLPNHLVYVGPKLLTASTPPPGGFLPSIPPSGRAAMRRVVITGDNSAPNELECIRLQGNTMKEGVARARMSRTRKRDEDKENVSAFVPIERSGCVCSNRAFGFYTMCRQLRGAMLSF